jgi:hypothetical protein
MTTTVLPRTAESAPDGLGRTGWTVLVALAVWLLLVICLGAAGAFVGPPGRPPLPIAIGVAGPLLVFFTALRLSPMGTLPLLLIPAYLVPLFLMLHTAALMQSRRVIRSRA